MHVNFINKGYDYKNEITILDSEGHYKSEKIKGGKQ